MQDKENPDSAETVEQKLVRTRMQVAIVELSYMHLGDFIHELARYVQKHGVMSGYTFMLYRTRAMLQIKDRPNRGWPIEAEIEILTGALKLVKHFFGSIVATSGEPLNPSGKTSVKVSQLSSREILSQGENPEYSPEQRLRIARKQLMMYGAAFVNLGEFILDLVNHHINQRGVVDAQALCQCRDHAMLQTKDTESQGLPIEDEADAMVRGLALVRRYLDSMAMGEK